MKKRSTSLQVSTAKSRAVLPYQTSRLGDHYLMGKKLGQRQFGTMYLYIHKPTGAHFTCKSISKHKLLCREDYNDVWQEI